MNAEPDLTLERFEPSYPRSATSSYELTLFVNGASERSAQAIANVRALCDAHLAGGSISTWSTSTSTPNW